MLDLAIIGGGPAGLTVGLYATRGGLKDVVMFEKGLPGGQITSSSEVENYPGVSDVVTGLELMENWPEQSMRFGMKLQMDEVTKVSKRDDGIFEIALMGKEPVEAKSVVVCTGATPRRSNVKGEDQFFGKGVSTCATCDAFFYKNREVAVLGGGDTALEEALFLANICSKVYLVHRRDTFRASPVTVERVRKNDKIELVLNSVVKEILGDASGVTGVLLEDKDKKERYLDVPGIFVFVGMNVNNDVLRKDDGSFICDMDSNGNVIVDLKMHTSLAGLFVAGDLRIDAAKQVVCAAADGAIAGMQALEYVNHL